MIKITKAAETALHTRAFVSEEERAILRAISRDPSVSAYSNARVLDFELRMREQTLAASRALNAAGTGFATFETSRCNPEYWIRQANGAFQLRPDRLPSAAIRDIFSNGPLYAFECATAIIILFYKATLETIGEAAYNQLFANTYLYHWNVDRDLGLTTRPAARFIPGDALYFDNPDVNPEFPEWQGENVIYMGDGIYYGHGLGMKTAEKMIEALNKRRIPGSTRSAFLLQQVTRPNYAMLSQSHASLQGGGGWRGGVALPGGIPIRARIGGHLFLDF